MSNEDTGADVEAAERKLKSSYEGKLATLAAINSALKAENEQLRRSVDASPNKKSEISELQEEFSKRLAVSERQALAAQDERDAMRAKLRDVEAECDRLASQLVKTERRAEAAEREAESIHDEWQAAKEEADLELEQVREEANKKLEAAKNETGTAALEREASLTKTLNETRMQWKKLHQLLLIVNIK